MKEVTKEDINASIDACVEANVAWKRVRSQDGCTKQAYKNYRTATMHMENLCVRAGLTHSYGWVIIAVRQGLLKERV
jgi:hypothetical protein